jgi:hypothetical protein
MLAGGTSSGRIGLWKYIPVAGEPEDQWQCQTPSVVNAPVIDLIVSQATPHILKKIFLTFMFNILLARKLLFSIQYRKE